MAFCAWTHFSHLTYLLTDWLSAAVEITDVMYVCMSLGTHQSMCHLTLSFSVDCTTDIDMKFNWNMFVTIFLIHCLIFVKYSNLKYIISHKQWIMKCRFCSTLSHTRYWALGPELIPVYRQSAHGWLFKSSPAISCCYFPPDLQSASQPKNVTVLRPVPCCTA